MHVMHACVCLLVCLFVSCSSGKTMETVDKDKQLSMKVQVYMAVVLLS